MCGRYNLGPPIPEDELREILRSVEKNTQSRELLDKLKTSGEIFPTNIVPVLVANEARAMHWGMPLYGGKFRVINTRDDSLTPRALAEYKGREYKKILTDGQRCLVPVVYYYEWEKRKQAGKKEVSIRYNFRIKNQPVMYVAGIYKVQDVEVPSFSIITTKPPEYIAWIHDRMPLILSPEAQKEWLSPDGAIDDVLRESVKTVEYQRDDDKPEQLDMFAGLE